MASLISEQQYRTSKQNIQNRYVRLELLNYNYQIVGELSGTCISGTISIDSNSDIRRTANIKLIVDDSSFEVTPGGKIWLDKYIRIWVGTTNLYTGTIEYINCGMYMIDAPSYNYNLTTNVLTLSLLDLMAKLTGVRNGYIQKAPVVLKAGENIRKAFIETLKIAGFNKYLIEDAPSPGTIPNDLNFGIGATYYDILANLRDIYPNYEIFFDINGVFYYKPIPRGFVENVEITDDLWENIVLNEDISTDFRNVKNSIEVFGRVHDPIHFANSDNTTIDNSGNLSLKIPSVVDYAEGVIYGFEILLNKDQKINNLKVNDKSWLAVEKDNGESPVIYKSSDKEIYCVQYTNNLWRWLGHLQAYGRAEDTDKRSPFCVTGTVGKIYLPLYDGVYSNCTTDDLAQERAEFELFMHTNLNNSLTLTCIPVYWIDVNTLVEYTTFRNKKKRNYLIKNINIGLSPNDNMTISLVQSYYGNIIKEIPSVVAPLYYNGYFQSPEWRNYDPEQLAIGGDIKGKDIGEYSTSFTPLTGNIWSDKTTSTKFVNWKIETKVIKNIPSTKSKLYYTGKTIEPVWENYNENELTIGGTTFAVEVGDYNTTFTPKKGYEWADGTTAQKTVSWRINRGIIELVPTASSIEYTGNIIEPVWNNYNPNELYYEGETKGAKVGKYTAKFRPKPNYEWKSPAGSQEEKRVIWEITPVVIKNKPTVFTDGYSNIYNGGIIRPTINNYDSNSTQKEGIDSATNVGRYQLSFMPKENYKWSINITSNPQEKFTYTWEILPIKVILPKSKSYNYTGSEITVSFDYDTNKLQIVEPKQLTATLPGNYKVNFKPTTNYAWSNKIDDNEKKEVIWKILGEQIIVPTTSSKLIYNKNRQSPVWDNYDSTKIEKIEYSQIDAGDYQTTFKLKTGFEWEDGTVEDKIIPWTINKAKINNIPTQIGKIECNGKSQSPNWDNNYTVDNLTISGDSSAIEPGSYSVTFTPTKNYEWADGGSEGKQQNWEIIIGTPTLTISSTSIKLSQSSPTITLRINYTGNETLQFAYIPDTYNPTGLLEVVLKQDSVQITAKDNTNAQLKIISPKNNCFNEVSAIIKIVSSDFGAYLPNFSENSWGQIIKACQEKKVPNTWSTGDAKTMTIGGIEYSIRILGRYHDTYTGSTEKAPLSFEMAGCGPKRLMHTSVVGNISYQYLGWENSAIRSYLNGEFMESMPLEVKNAVKSVDKATGKYSGNTASISITSDKIWLLAQKEVFNNVGKSFPDEANKLTQYDFYRIKLVSGGAIKKYENVDVKWGLRSPVHLTDSAKNKTQYCIVTNTGEQGTDSGGFTFRENPINFSACFCF